MTIARQLVKDHLRIDHSEADALIDEYIAFAIERVESDSGRALIDRTCVDAIENWPARPGMADAWWNGTHDGPIWAFLQPAGSIRLTVGPVKSVTSIVTTDRDGVALTWDATSYRLGYDDDTVYGLDGALWAQGRTLITYQAGYGATWNDYPSALRTGILDAVAWRYRYRGDEDAPPLRLPSVEKMKAPRL